MALHPPPWQIADSSSEEEDDDDDGNEAIPGEEEVEDEREGKQKRGFSKKLRQIGSQMIRSLRGKGSSSNEDTGRAALDPEMSNLGDIYEEP